MAWLQAHYLWIVAVHVILVIFWMAGLFMLPRYLVYHQEAIVAGRTDEAALWAEREGKIRGIILTPAMIGVWLFGLTLATVSHQWGAGWLHAKLLLVLLLSGYHGWAVGYAKRLARGEMRASGRTLRMLNEVPALLGIAIVLLAFVKPF